MSVDSGRMQSGRKWWLSPTGEVVVGFLCCLVVFVWIIHAFNGSYWGRVHNFGDNGSYATIARAIRTGDFTGLSPTHFWGFPALVSIVVGTGLADEYGAIVTISILSGLFATVVVARKWRVEIGLLLLALSSDWMQRTFLGGAEPFFCLLVFLGLWLMGNGRWVEGTLLAACATLVRPLGVILVLAALAVLLRTKRQKTFWTSLLVAGGVGMTYASITLSRFSDPIANVSWYRKMGLGVDPTFVPFLSMVKSYARGETTVTNLGQMLFWNLFWVVGIVSTLRSDPGRTSVERVFCLLYLISMLAMPAWWLNDELGRYLVPVVPIVVSRWRDSVQLHHRLVWCLCGMGCVFSAASAVGVRNVLGIVARWFNG